jgi:hypothetical protein
MGSRVGCYDYDRDAVEQLLKQANEGDKVDSSGVHGFSSLEKLVGAFPKSKRLGRRTHSHSAEDTRPESPSWKDR